VNNDPLGLIVWWYWKPKILHKPTINQEDDGGSSPKIGTSVYSTSKDLNLKKNPSKKTSKPILES